MNVFDNQPTIQKIIDIFTDGFNYININDFDYLFCLDNYSTYNYIFNNYISTIYIYHNLTFNLINSLIVYIKNNYHDCFNDFKTNYFFFKTPFNFIYNDNHEQNKIININIIYQNINFDINPFKNIYYSINNKSSFSYNINNKITPINNLMDQFDIFIDQFPNLFNNELSTIFDIIIIYLITNYDSVNNIIKNFIHMYQNDKIFKKKIKNEFDFDNDIYINKINYFLIKINDFNLLNQWIYLTQNKYKNLNKILFNLNDISFFDIKVTKIDDYIKFIIISKYKII